MRFPDLREGEFVSRPNRFGAWVRVGQNRLYLYVPNSGRLAELLVPGAQVLWRPTASRERRTCGDLLLVRKGRRWVVVDSRLPPLLLAEAARACGGLEPFGRCREPVFEPPLGAGRADLLLPCGGDRLWLVETKCITLAVNGTARFPDAPTSRGVRHMRELAEIARAGALDGRRPAVAFVCQRCDVYSFRPHDLMDPDFGAALRAAAGAGVVVVAYRCRVSARGVQLWDHIAVDLT